MKVCYKLVLLVWIFVMGLPLIWEWSWQSDSCIENKSCLELSSEYTVPYCVMAGDVDNARKCNFSSLINSLSTDLNSDNYNTKDMISRYCTSLLWNQNDWRIYYAQPSTLTDTRDWSKTFDSHQSLFVYLLCSSTVGKTESFDLSWVFTWDVVKILKLQQKVDWKDQCSKDHKTLNDCDMSLYATEIFSALMSEVFKIKYAQVFHVDSVETFQKDKKKRVSAFLSWYFGMNNEEDIMKNFPNTVDVVESNQQYYKSVLENLRIIDNSALAKIAEESKCPIQWNMDWINFIACALHGSQWNWLSLDSAFDTLLYNELMSYRIFVSYYWQWAQAKFDNDKINADVRTNLQSQAVDLQAYSNLQIDAAKETLHNFEELNMSYPLHIGLLLYQEKVKEFRNKTLPPIIKTFYSLSQKLQNVQLPK